MANLKSIRKRITSVKNTQKITRAMKMVAAAKLRRAQNALTGSRPHHTALAKTIERILVSEEVSHPLLHQVEQPKKAQLLVITSDRGLCGGFNGNLLRKVDHFLDHDGKGFEQIELSVIGRKGRDYYRAKKVNLASAESMNLEGFSFEAAHQLSKVWLKKFQESQFEVLFLAFNAFKSAISQTPTIKQVLPFGFEPPEGILEVRVPIKFEGDPQQMIGQLLERYLTTEFYLAVLESQASELGSRMSAMDNATNNASDMIGSLTLQYNRARQAAITTELMDIVNGAEALG